MWFSRLFNWRKWPTPAEIGALAVGGKAVDSNHADSAAKLDTARAITLGGDLSGSANFDGSGNITITAAVLDDSHNHSSYLLKSGDASLAGNKEFYATDSSGAYGTSAIEVREVGLVAGAHMSAAYAPAVSFHWADRAHGQIALESDGVFYFRDGVNHAVRRVLGALAFVEDGVALAAKYLGINANAVSASKLQTARTITLGGDLSGAASFDGSGNITITAAVLDGSHEHLGAPKLDGTNNIYSGSTIAQGRAGGAVRGYFYNDSSGVGLLNYTGAWAARLVYGTSDLMVYGAIYEGAELLSARYLGIGANAVSASKLQTARTITLGGDLSGAASFDGSGNITITAAVLDDSHNHEVATGYSITGGASDKAVHRCLQTGIIKMWGRVTSTSLGVVEYFDFPEVFPNGISYLNINAGGSDITIRRGGTTSVDTNTRTRFELMNNSGAAKPIFWEAVGH